MGMRCFKKFAILAMALVLMFSMTIPASAAGDGSNTSGETAPAAKAKVTSTNGNYSKKTITVKYSGTDAVKYKIAYKKAGAKTWTYKTTTNKSSYVLKLKANGLYQIKVAGINKDGKQGSFTSVRNRYINGSKVKATAKKKSMKVTSAKVSDITGYKIYYSTKKSMKGQKVVTVKTTKALSKTVKGLKKGKTYYVMVRPYKVYGGKTYYGIARNVVKVKIK